MDRQQGIADYPLVGFDICCNVTASCARKKTLDRYVTDLPVCKTCSTPTLSIDTSHVNLTRCSFLSKSLGGSHFIDHHVPCSWNRKTRGPTGPYHEPGYLNVEWRWVYWCITSHATIFQSYNYVTAQMCRRTEEVVPTVGLPTP